ncbi:MAG: hypothetical protein M1G31_09665 [Pseudanabaena sp. Salubria-1]|nr:hypothetical protein [Pseudanabaena sp. Salubria-1]
MFYKSDRSSSQIKQQSLILSDTINVQSDLHLTRLTNNRNSSQIKLRSHSHQHILSSHNDYITLSF